MLVLLSAVASALACISIEDSDDIAFTYLSLVNAARDDALTRRNMLATQLGTHQKSSRFKLILWLCLPVIMSVIIVNALNALLGVGAELIELSAMMLAGAILAQVGLCLLTFIINIIIWRLRSYGNQQYVKNAYKVVFAFFFVAAVFAGGYIYGETLDLRGFFLGFVVFSPLLIFAVLSLTTVAHGYNFGYVAARHVLRADQTSVENLYDQYIRLESREEPIILGIKMM